MEVNGYPSISEINECLLSNLLYAGVSHRRAISSVRTILCDLGYNPMRCSKLATWMVDSLVERGIVHVMSF